MTSSGDRQTDGFERTLRNALHTELAVRMRHVLLHDLKGPGQIILSALHMLQKNAATADAATLQKYCDWIRNAVKDLAERAENVLPPKPAGAAAAPETCDLAALTEDATHLLRDDAALAGVEFRIETANPLPPAPGPRGELLLALQAMLFGVLDSVPQNSTVYIHLAETNKGTEWSAAVPDGDRPEAEAFEARYEVEPPRSGIGWHVARSIARSRGGDLTVEDIEDGGWRLVLRLP